MARGGALVALMLAMCAPLAATAAADVDDIPYDQPAPGGEVVSVTWNVTVGRRAPDCFVRDVLLINDRFLGRRNAITVHQGDVLDLTLLNSLPADYPDTEGGLTLHFHGFAMAAGASPWYDGVPFLHQCPLRPGGSSMRYRFRVNEAPGTFWAHAHVMAIMDGLFAPLIVLPPRGSADPALAALENPPSPPSSIVDIPLMVGDWYHGGASALQFGLNRPFDPAKVVNDSSSGGGSSAPHGAEAHAHNHNATGKWAWVDNPQSILFNGRGFYGDCAVGPAGSKVDPACGPPALTVPPGRAAVNPAAAPSDPGCTHEVVAVPAGRTARLRLIGVGSLAYLTICVEGHALTVIAADGIPVQPFNSTCVDLNLGQRLDVLLTADKGSASAGDVFWVTATPAFRPGTPAGYAVLRYLNADGTDPTSSPARLPSTKPLQPGSTKAWGAADQARIRAPAWAVGGSKAVNGGELKPADAAELPGSFQDLRPPPTTMPPVLFNITQPLLQQTGQMRWALNNVATGGTPGCGAYLADVRARGGLAAVKDDAAATQAEGGPAADDDLLGKQTVSDSERAPTFVVGLSPVVSTPTVGRLLVAADAGSVVDIIINNLPANSNGGDYRPDGANRTVSEMHPVHWHGYHGWLLGTGDEGAGPFDESRDRPTLNTADPPLRDSVTILPNSWVVVRLPLHTPGAWLLHCHMHSHASMGMAAVFGVGLDSIPPQPGGFPACERECPSAAAPWTPEDVREEWGDTNYDLGPETLPQPDADGAAAPAVNGSTAEGGRR